MTATSIASPPSMAASIASPPSLAASIASPPSMAAPAAASTPPQAPLAATTAPRPDATLRKAAEAFEAVFLAEMLAHAGLGRMPQGFGGGSGESAFSSFLTRAYAEKLAAGGRFGLAEAIVRSAAPRDGIPAAEQGKAEGHSNG